MITIDNFIEKMLYFFPQIRVEVSEHINTFGERLYTIIIEDIVMPNVIEMIKRNDKQKIEEVFGYFERVSSEADEYLLNIFSITALEILGNDMEILSVAKRYMGPKTIQYQKEADLDLGRIIE